MRRSFAWLLVLLCLFSLSAQAADHLTLAMTWDDLVSLAAAGTSPIYLGANLTAEEGNPLCADGSVIIYGNGFSLTGAVVGGGRVQFSDIALYGVNGMNDQCGGNALSIEGEGTVVIFSASASATGGRSGVSGLEGGHGVVLSSDGVGLILRGSASATGGIGRYQGGSAVSVQACNTSLLLTDATALVGGAGGNLGAAAVSAPACCKLQLLSQTSLAGGDGYLDGGDGLLISACEICEHIAPVALGETCVAVGGMGLDGGSAVNVSFADLTFTGTPMFFGGAGQTGGAALTLSDCTVHYFMDSLMLFGGGYSSAPSSVSSISRCMAEGDESLILETQGSLLSSMPAEQVPEIVEIALRQKTGRETNEEITNSITALPLSTRVADTKLSVDKGKVSQAQVSGTSLKIRVYNITNENYFSFTQRFFSQDENVYYLLIADQSQQGYTINASAAALRKLFSLGVTHFCYSSVSPIYCERILSLETLLEDMDGMNYPVEKVLFGTADDCVIYVDEDGNQEYRVSLMGEALCPVPMSEEADLSSHDSEAAQ